MKLQRKRGFYEKYIKRLIDIICSLLTIFVLFWLYVVIAILVRIKLGSPVLFKQPRPGLINPKTGKETIFDMYKFRTMSDIKDANGELLPDEVRLGEFGKKLRATSLDELPEIFNILNGDMSVIGPRPQLVRDMVFMTEEQRMRHTAKPGLSGLAQIMGRNAISWEEKFKWDLKYIDNISFLGDWNIIWITIKKVFFRGDMTASSEEIDVTLDYGDVLLKDGKVTREQYDNLRAYAANLIKEHNARQA